MSSHEEIVTEMCMKKRRRNFLSIEVCEEKLSQQEEGMKLLKGSAEWKDMTPAERRRLRNLHLAQRTRLRNKAAERDAVEQLKKLKSENESLREQLGLTTSQHKPLPASALLAADCAAPVSLLGGSETAGATLPPHGPQHGEEEDSKFFMISTLSSRLVIVHASPQFLNLTGYERADLIGQHGLSLFTGGAPAVCESAAVAGAEGDKTTTNAELFDLQCGLKLGFLYRNRSERVLHLQRKDGLRVTARCKFEPATVLDASGRSFLVRVCCEEALDRPLSPSADGLSAKMQRMVHECMYARASSTPPVGDGSAQLASNIDAALDLKARAAAGGVGGDWRSYSFDNSCDGTIGSASPSSDAALGTYELPPGKQLSVLSFEDQA